MNRAVFAAAWLVLGLVPAAPASGQVCTGSEQKISATAGGFGGVLDAQDGLGSAVAALGDLDGDGTADLAVGAPRDDDGGSNRGAVWILFLRPDGTVKAEQKISATAGGFGGALADGDEFGFSLAALGDLDGDGTGDLAAGVPKDGDGGFRRGAVWILFLHADGTVKAEQKISATAGGFGGLLDDLDQFGWSVAGLGDLDGDGVADLAAGAGEDGDGGPPGVPRGAVWILFLHADGTVKAEQKISATAGGFGGTLDERDFFGSALAAAGDLDGNGVGDLAAGAYRDDDGGLNRGAVWILFMRADGTVQSEQKISATSGGFGGLLGDGDEFGYSLAGLGDLDGDGTGDLAAGLPLGDDGGFDRGALWILFLNPDGTVKSEQRISATAGGFGGQLDDLDRFGLSVAGLGDLDGDGIGDLAAGAPQDDDGGFNRGALWELFLAFDRIRLTRVAPRSGPVQGGNVVTLHGECFTRDTSVDFGGIAAPRVIYLDSFSIDAEVPPLALPGLGALGPWRWAAWPHRVPVDVTVANGAMQDTLRRGYAYRR